MAAIAVRSVFRSSNLIRRAAAEARSSSPLRMPQLRSPSSSRLFVRIPVEASFCLESMLPLHSRTANALMTSKLSISNSGFGFLSEGASDDV